MAIPRPDHGLTICASAWREADTVVANLRASREIKSNCRLAREAARVGSLKRE